MLSMLFAFNPLHPLLLHDRGRGTRSKVCFLCGTRPLDLHDPQNSDFFNFCLQFSFTLMQPHRCTTALQLRLPSSIATATVLMTTDLILLQWKAPSSGSTA